MYSSRSVIATYYTFSEMVLIILMRLSSRLVTKQPESGHLHPKQKLRLAPDDPLLKNGEASAIHICPGKLDNFMEQGVDKIVVLVYKSIGYESLSSKPLSGWLF